MSRRRRSRRSSAINPHAGAHRGALRALGMVLAIAGGALTAIGVIDFFGSFGSVGGGMPTKFWMAMVGLPMLGLGIMLLKLGYLGTISRYLAGETAPVAGDTFNHVARRAAPGVRALSSAMRGGADGAALTCPGCGADNGAGAAFCDQCGDALVTAPVTCRGCGVENDDDARFCDSCGRALAS